VPPDRPDAAHAPHADLSLADYVHGEALDTVPEELRTFLRAISLLPVWTPALCNDVTGRRDSERLLKELSGRVLFVTQHAEEPPMYRCHQLMRTLLMQGLRRDDPAAYAEQGRSAAETLSRFGLLNEAVELMFELEEWSQAAEVLEEIALRLIQQGQSHGLAEWIDRLPIDARAKRPRLQLWRGRGALAVNMFDEALRLSDEALRMLRPAGDSEAIVEALLVRGEAYRYKGQNEDAVSAFEEAQLALSEASEDDPRLVGQVLRNLGVTHTLNGDLDAGIKELEQARPLLERAGDLAGIGKTCAMLAKAYSGRGQPMEALGALQRAQSAFERAGNTYDAGLTLNNTGMVYYELGEYEQALSVYERGLRLVRGTGSTQEEAFIMAGIAETYRMMGRLDESLAAYEEVRPLADGLQVAYLSIELAEGMALTKLALGHGEEAAQLARSVKAADTDAPERISRHELVNAHIALERGDAAGALRHIDVAWKVLDAAGNVREKAVASFLRARALYENHQPRKAMSELEQVHRLCERLGYRRFLRPYVAHAREMVAYARARHIAEALLTELASETPKAQAKAKKEQPASEMLPVVRALCLGRGSVFVGERQVSDIEWRSEKSKEMFFLLLAKKDPVTKDEIFSALWPDLPESKCNSNFHSSLYRLRRALFHECVVRGSDGAYALNPKGVFESDVDLFNRAMLEAEVARDEEARVGKLEEAVNTYKGAYMSATYSEWVEPTRRELEDRCIEALNELGAWKLRHGAFEEALVLFKALDAVDSYSDAAAYGIMRCYLALNDGPSAARFFRRFRQLLKDELDEEPSERVIELYKQASAQT
jgi:two-component SAPR family response regulator